MIRATSLWHHLIKINGEKIPINNMWFDLKNRCGYFDTFEPFVLSGDFTIEIKSINENSDIYEKFENVHIRKTVLTINNNSTIIYRNYFDSNGYYFVKREDVR